MFHVKSADLLIAAAIAGLVALPGQRANADEVIMQVTRTTSDAVPVVPVTTTKTTTTETTRTVVSDPAQTTTTIVTPGTTVVAPGTVVVSSSTAVPLSIDESAAILQTVTTRRAALDKAIVDARTAGTLSEAQAASLRRELDRIGAEVTVLQTQPNLLRSIVVAQDLDALTVSLRQNVSTVALVPIIEGSHFTVFNGRILQLDDLAVRRIGLENKILAAQAAGRISWDQANHMRSQLNAIAATESAYKANGALDFKAVKQIYRDFDQVANELDRATH